MQTVAGYNLQEIISTKKAQVEHWKAIGNSGVAEVFIVPKEWESRYRSLPKNWGAFVNFTLQDFQNKLAVIVPGFLNSDLKVLEQRLGSEASVIFAWHIASAISLLHDSGGSHGILHPNSIGLDDLGQLSIRPAIGESIVDDPDSTATAQATDCWQLGFVFQSLGISGELDERLSLLMAGLHRERSLIRMQPASAIRQSIIAVGSRNPSWEEALKKQLGDDWAMDLLPPLEQTIIPKLYPQRPRAALVSSVDTQNYNPWSSPFRSNPNKKPRIQVDMEQKGIHIQLPTPMDDMDLLDEELDAIDEISQKVAQIRLPFAPAVVAPTGDLSQLTDDMVEEDFEEFSLVSEVEAARIEIPLPSFAPSPDNATDTSARSENRPKPPTAQVESRTVSLPEPPLDDPVASEVIPSKVVSKPTAVSVTDPEVVTKNAVKSAEIEASVETERVADAPKNVSFDESTSDAQEVSLPEEPALEMAKPEQSTMPLKSISDVVDSVAVEERAKEQEPFEPKDSKT
ncbi:MAG: hypothetical protein VX278_11835, partial [Myxococcota bacterium]|nr:hypothetical protein [Myxococcota bacterium]